MALPGLGSSSAAARGNRVVGPTNTTQHEQRQHRDSQTPVQIPNEGDVDARRGSSGARILTSLWLAGVQVPSRWALLGCASARERTNRRTHSRSGVGTFLLSGGIHALSQKRYKSAKT